MGGAEGRRSRSRHRDTESLLASDPASLPKVSSQRLDWRLVDKMAARRGCQRQGAQAGARGHAG